MDKLYSIMIIGADIESAERLRRVLQGYAPAVIQDDGVTVAFHKRLPLIPRKGEEVDIEGETFRVSKIRYKIQGNINKTYVPDGLYSIEMYIVSE